MNVTNPLLACDFYKVSHKAQYPDNTQYIYSNFTPRSSKLAPKLDGVFNDKIVFFGLQRFMKKFLIDSFNEQFFDKQLDVVIAEYERHMNNALGGVDTTHIAALHKLGYLPISIKALPEGSLVNIKVPVLTITNTHPDFYWLPNYLESVMSAELWKPSTTATTAYQYRKLLDKFADETGSNKDFVMWQGHDFSMRGLSGLDDCANSGMGHLLSFYGTDSIPAIESLEQYYFGKDCFIGGSVPASEHSVMTIMGPENETECIRRLITKVHPTGVVSVVPDGYDYWNVITNTLPLLKDEILARKENSLGLAKVVARPDSGDPADIICGDSKAKTWYEQQGSVQCLWNIFDGTTNVKEYRELNQRVGLIYGDSITLTRAEDILQRLKDKKFASSNIVLGIGSYTYQYVTRDSHGFAMKATHGIVDGVARDIYKDPKTGDGFKKSARGLLRVEKEGNNFVLYDQQTVEQEKQGALEQVFLNSEIVKFQTLQQIRELLHSA